ncbi:hypothetical protein N3K66_008917 [Trichothecium roseum]|uniref:Uncharacterized protein n=1 Tax=Trichothecium roseum TaxID=47278 RepID=A0ACC0USP3_9HYPO|nr:hypothetical protein N3K66_008917 [Trichothecium roseum]
MTTRALVVGGTGGIGHAIAARLASDPNTHVTISGRTQPASMPANTSFLPLDASSMHAIRTYASNLKSQATTSTATTSTTTAAKENNPATPQRLDYLVLTQGVFTLSSRTETPHEHMDNKMALHHYGRHLLIRELGPLLKPDAKILVVLDALRGDPRKLNWDDLDLKNTYSLANAMAHCLAMNDAMIQWHASRQQQQNTTSSSSGDVRRHFVHAYPGTVNTGIGKNLPWIARSAIGLLLPLVATSPEICAENLLAGTRASAAAGGETGRSWAYIDQKGREITGKPVWTEEQINRVAEHTWKITDEAIAKGAAAAAAAASA